VLKFHNYTGILPIIHLLFCSESRNMLQGPICKFSKVWGLNCNFPKFRDQIEFLSSSTSNPEFSQITYCYPLISNTNSPFKQNHNSKSSFLSTIFQIQLNNPLITHNNQPYNIQFNSSIKPKTQIFKTRTFIKTEIKAKENILYTLKHNLTIFTYFLQLLSISLLMSLFCFFFLLFIFIMFI